MKSNSLSLPLISVLVLGTALDGMTKPGLAQGTAPFNPNEENPASDVDLDGLGDTATDIGNTADEAADIVENATGDLESAVDDQVDDLNETVNEVTEDVFGDSGTISDIDSAVGDVFGSIDRIEGSINDLIGTFESLLDTDRLFDVFSIELPDILSDALGGLAGGGSSGETVAIETGALGLPDPEVIEEGIQNAQPSAFEEIAGTKTGGEGSPVIKQDLVTQFERDLVDEVADSTALTEEGQQKLRENAEAATTALETSQQLATDSAEQDVSQNILRNLSEQVAAQQSTDTLQAVDAQLRARDDAMRNKMLVDAVRELQGDRVQDRRETAAAYSDSITQGGQLLLPGTGIDPAGEGD